MRRSAGFTLIELLVALGLLAVLGVLEWRGLDYVLTQRTQIDREADELDRLITTFAQLDRDIGQRMPASSSLARGALAPHSQPWIRVLDAAPGVARLALLRQVADAHGRTRAHWVRYVMSNGDLVRESALAVAATHEAGSRVVMLTNLRGFSVRLLASTGWREPGADTVDGNAQFNALEVVFERMDATRFRRVYAL